MNLMGCPRQVKGQAPLAPYGYTTASLWRVIKLFKVQTQYKSQKRNH